MYDFCYAFLLLMTCDINIMVYSMLICKIFCADVIKWRHISIIYGNLRCSFLLIVMLQQSSRKELHLCNSNIINFSHVFKSQTAFKESSTHHNCLDSKQTFLFISSCTNAQLWNSTFIHHLLLAYIFPKHISFYDLPLMKSL